MYTFYSGRFLGKHYTSSVNISHCFVFETSIRCIFRLFVPTKLRCIQIQNTSENRQKSSKPIEIRLTHTSHTTYNKSTRSKVRIISIDPPFRNYRPITKTPDHQHNNIDNVRLCRRWQNTVHNTRCTANGDYHIIAINTGGNTHIHKHTPSREKNSNSRGNPAKARENLSTFRRRRFAVRAGMRIPADSASNKCGAIFARCAVVGVFGGSAPRMLKGALFSRLGFGGGFCWVRRRFWPFWSRVGWLGVIGVCGFPCVGCGFGFCCGYFVCRVGGFVWCGRNCFSYCLVFVRPRDRILFDNKTRLEISDNSP